MENMLDMGNILAVVDALGFDDEPAADNDLGILDEMLDIDADGQRIAVEFECCEKSTWNAEELAEELAEAETDIETLVERNAYLVGQIRKVENERDLAFVVLGEETDRLEDRLIEARRQRNEAWMDLEEEKASKQRVIKANKLRWERWQRRCLKLRAELDEARHLDEDGEPGFIISYADWHQTLDELEELQRQVVEAREQIILACR